MSVPVRVVTPARRDLIQITIYLAERDPRVAARFRRAVQAGLDRLAHNPDSGSLWPTNDERLRGLRVSAIPGFRRHLLFHRHTNGEVVVVRLLHASQDAAEIFSREEEPDVE